MKIRKILLITPPNITFKLNRDVNPLPPMGLGYLAAVIEQLGIEVDILDALMMGWQCEEEVNDSLIRVGLPDKEIENYLRDFDPDIVGINCQFSRQYKVYHQLFNLVKKVKPDCLTIAGGAHPTVCPEEVLSDPACDFVIIGEGEDSFKEFVLRLTKDEDVTSVDGLGWKSQGEIRINPKQHWLTDLDAIPFPAYHTMKLESYFGLTASHGTRHKERFSPIVTSRGCPAKCTFCSARRVWGDRFRFRSVANVLQEMRLLKERYGIQELMFEDDNVTANPKRAKKIFSGMIEQGFNFIWDTPNGVGVWSVDEEMIDLMQQSGCVNLNFPVESGSQYVLDNIIKKPLNLRKVKHLIKYCQQINLNYNMFLVVGLPGETLSDIKQSFRFAAECGCYHPHISVATPYPGTQLFADCVANGYFSKPFVLDDLFIRSFMIRTKNHTESELRRALLKGQLYLLLKEAMAEPGQVARRIVKHAGNFSKVKRFIRGMG